MHTLVLRLFLRMQEWWVSHRRDGGRREHDAIALPGRRGSRTAAQWTVVSLPTGAIAPSMCGGRHLGWPVEVQVRTGLQDAWAQLFERFADVFGRGLRYGGQAVPSRRNGLAGLLQNWGVERERRRLLRLSAAIDSAERSGGDVERRVRKQMDRCARAVERLLRREERP